MEHKKNPKANLEKHNKQFMLLGLALALIVIYIGIEFKTFERTVADLGMVDVSLEERQVGGLGIHIVHKIMDQVYYQRRINKNEVKLVKKISDELSR